MRRQLRSCTAAHLPVAAASVRRRTRAIIGAALRIFAVLACQLPGRLPAEPPIPPAFGPHVNLAATDFDGVPSFSSSDRIVGTYYFYWYDSATKSHLVDHDGSDALTTHPPTLDDFSYKSVRWHRQQLLDMEAAGIDIVLPVFWGAPSEHDPQAGLHWSYAGLGPLVEARDQLANEDRKPPRIGLFYDTSTLQHNRWGLHVDLTTDYGREWFYATIRDFFSMIPPRHWAMIDGRPVVLLYSAAFAKAHDQSCIDHVKSRFPQQFGGRVPWIAREVSWQVQADSTVAWGGALGLKNPGVASLGPGYDHSAVPGRDPLVVDRRDGRFYQENWRRFLQRPGRFVMVETWNEFHEGTDVAESREYGRQYIDLTRKYSDMFRAGVVPEHPRGRFTGANSVHVTLGDPNIEDGLRQIDAPDGATAPATAAGRGGRAPQATAHGGRYIYFAADDTFKWAHEMDAILKVDFFDAAAGAFHVEFDGSDPQAPFSGAYTRAPDSVILTGSMAWRTARINLPAARLLHGQNLDADFRLALDSGDLIVGAVRLLRGAGDGSGDS